MYECPLCLEDDTDETLIKLVRCKHQLHQKCLTQLLNCEDENVSNRCPVCRDTLQEKVNPNLKIINRTSLLQDSRVNIFDQVYDQVYESEFQPDTASIDTNDDVVNRVNAYMEEYENSRFFGHVNEYINRDESAYAAFAAAVYLSTISSSTDIHNPSIRYNHV